MALVETLGNLKMKFVIVVTEVAVIVLHFGQLSSLGLGERSGPGPRMGNGVGDGSVPFVQDKFVFFLEAEFDAQGSCRLLRHLCCRPNCQLDLFDSTEGVFVLGLAHPDVTVEQGKVELISCLRNRERTV